MQISPVIIVKNAARTIAQTLESLKEFDEVVVYDTGSTDETIEIARQYENVKLCIGKFNGFGKSKNKAALMAKNDWILSIDADEVVSPQLMNSIKSLKPDKNFVYTLKRYNYYRKRRIKYSGWGLELVTRLYNKSQVNFNEKLVHEHIESENFQNITLEGELRHYSYSSVSDFIQKRDLYSELFAKENAGKKVSSPSKAMIHASFDFFNTYFLKAAFLDGYRGLLISVLNANVSFYKYLKLYEANLRNDSKVSLIILLEEDNPRKIARLIDSVLYQTIAPDEMILLLNSMSHGTKEILEKYSKESFIPIHFSGQVEQDSLFVSFNQIIQKAGCEYLIFIEGTGVLNKNFIHDHLKYSKRGHYVWGVSMFINKRNSMRSIDAKLNSKQHLSGYRYLHLAKLILSMVTKSFNLSKNTDKELLNLSFFKDELGNNLETKASEVDYAKFRNNILRKLKSSGLKKRSLQISGVHYLVNQNYQQFADKEQIDVLVCLDRLKNLNCGLGQVSLNMGRRLSKINDKHLKINFLLPGNGFNEFDGGVQSTRLSTFRYFFSGYMKKYDVCHVIHQLPSFRFGEAKRNLLTIHDLNFLITKSEFKKRKYLRELQENIYKSDAITFISEFTKQISCKYLDIPSDKITRVIYNGVIAPPFEPIKPDWLPEKPFLFSIGQFLEKKNFHVLLPFLKMLPEDTMLVIAGENKTAFGNKVVEQANELNIIDRLILPGAISEKEKNYLYHHCHAFVFPSIAEGFGLPVIEAMLSDKPVFCSNRTSLKEIGNEFAFFWKNFEPENMLNVYFEGMNKFKDESFRLNQKEYASRFTYERNIEQYLELYKELSNL